MTSRRLHGRNPFRDAQSGTATLQYGNRLPNKVAEPGAAIMPTRCDARDVVKYGVQGIPLVDIDVLDETHSRLICCQRLWSPSVWRMYVAVLGSLKDSRLCDAQPSPLVVR